ncbi:MAG TPA: cupin domain-containing protein, partial [Bryobacteraceae bacterium]|nr:cupin domain-containing protein [Bryobacteraceae bacterium]
MSEDNGLNRIRYGIDSYLEWVNAEGVPVVKDYGVDLLQVETAEWPRFGMRGASVHLEGRGDFCSMFVFEIPPAGSSSPQRHLYEEAIYVLEGRGSTQIEFADGRKHSFEWGQRSLFAIPLNAKYRLFNASGRERARVVSTTDLPLVMNTFHNEKFIFENDFDFSDRVGKSEYFTGQGDLIAVRPGNHMWETNFVPDLAKLELKAWSDRGAGGSNIMFV